MAERRPVRERKRESDDELERDDELEGESGQQADLPRLTAAKAGKSAMQQIAELTGKEPESVTGVEPAEDGWLVTIEVVEDRRIPSSTDLLATYEAELGPDGDLLSYRRLRHYTRGSGDDGNR